MLMSTIMISTVLIMILKEIKLFVITTISYPKEGSSFDSSLDCQDNNSKDSDDESDSQLEDSQQKAVLIIQPQLTCIIDSLQPVGSDKSLNKPR